MDGATYLHARQQGKRYTAVTSIEWSAPSHVSCAIDCHAGSPTPALHLFKLSTNDDTPTLSDASP
jgi:hypothetical protein